MNLAALATALGGAIVLYAFSALRHGERALTPDGVRYLAMGTGRRVALPFALRWLLPRLCRDSVVRWRWCTAAHLVALCPLLAVWLDAWLDDHWRSALASLLVAGLPGVWLIHVRSPVLVDAAAITWALGSAVAMQHGWWAPAIAAALVSGCIKESAPVFAACYAWSAWPLLGLAAPAARRVTVTLGPDIFDAREAWILTHPIRAGLAAHRGRWLDPRAMALPWGAGWLAVAGTSASMLPMLLTTLVLAYAQLIAATDTVRLYQWAAPPVILAAAGVVPTSWLPVVLAAHIANPWAGRGV